MGPIEEDGEARRNHEIFIAWAHRDRRWGSDRARRFKETVSGFAYLLDEIDGLHVEVDLFHYDDRGIDFTRWGPQQVASADSVLLVSSAAMWERWSGRNPPHEGAGVARESDALHGLFDKDQAAFQQKVLIVVLPGETDSLIPDELSRVQWHAIEDVTVEGIELLLRRLLNKPRYPRPTRKIIPKLPPYHQPETTAAPIEPQVDQGMSEPDNSSATERRTQRATASTDGMPEDRRDHLASERRRLGGKNPSP